MAHKKVTTLRLSDEAMRVLRTMSARYGISLSAVMELALREIAARDASPLSLLTQERPHREPSPAPL